MSMKSLIVTRPWRRRASACWRSAASRCIERCTIRRNSGSVTLLSRSVSYWLNSAWTSASASARSTKPSRLVSRFSNSARARACRSASGIPLGMSLENGGSATLRNSSTVSLPAFLVSSWSKVFMRYLRNSARVTSPLLAVSISWNHSGSGTGAVAAAGGVVVGAGAAGAGAGVAGAGLAGGVCAAAGNVTADAATRIERRRRFIVEGLTCLRREIRIGGEARSVNGLSDHNILRRNRAERVA